MAARSKTTGLSALALAFALSTSREAAAQDPAGSPRRRALLVGIQAYPARADWPALSGPRADLEALRAALVERAGFELEGVRVLLDEQATHQAILASFRELVEESAPGDVLLFYFAGHGSQILDQDGDEHDGYDETLIPFDAETAEGPNDIRDDELRELVRAANRKTDHVVLVFDCCSSGTNVRGDEGDVRRFVPSAARGLAGARTEVRNERQPSREEGSSYFEEELAYVALSACRASQSAYEIEFEPGKKRGLFTASLVQELYEPAGELTYRDLLERVRRRVGARRPTQTPLIEGPLGSRLLFARVEAWRMPAYALLVSNDELVLSAGTIHGLAQGSILSACDELATEDSAERRIGRIRITEVGALESKAAWLDPPQASLPSARLKAFLVARGAAEERAGFALSPANPSDQERAAVLARALERTGLLRAVEPQEATYLFWPQEIAGVRSWRVFTRGDLALPLAAAMNVDGETERLVSQLSRLAIAARLRNLRGPASSRLVVETSLERLDSEGRSLGELEAGAQGSIELRPGEHLRARLVNRSQVPLFATFFVISPDGAIEVLEVTTEDDPLPPGRDARTEPFHTMVEAGNEPFYRAGADCYRWIATTRYQDWRELRQKPVSSADELRGERGTPLGELARRESEEDSWFTCASEVRISVDG